MSTRVAVMDQGRTLQVAPPRELFARPADIIVATFIGTPAMNIVPATIVTTPGGPAMKLLGLVIPLSRSPMPLEDLKEVQVGIRPQAIKLVRPGSERITGQVFLREPLGLEDEVLVHVEKGTRLKVVTAGGEEFLEGATVGLDFDLTDVYLFHPESKRTIHNGVDGSGTIVRSKLKEGFEA